MMARIVLLAVGVALGTTLSVEAQGSDPKAPAAPPKGRAAGVPKGRVAFLSAAEFEAGLDRASATAPTFDKPVRTVDLGEYRVTIVILRRIPVEGRPDRGL